MIIVYKIYKLKSKIFLFFTSKLCAICINITSIMYIHIKRDKKDTKTIRIFFKQKNYKKRLC